MKVTFDKVADAIYFTLREGKVVRTMPISDSIAADVDVNDHVIGIEVLDVSNQFANTDLEEIEKRVIDGIPLTITSKTPLAA